MSVVDHDHLVKKEIEMDLGHLANDREKFPKPNVDLLGGGRVEDPGPLVVARVLAVEFGEKGWIAVLVAKLVGSLVLGGGVEYVNGHSHAVEAFARAGNVLKMFEQRAIVVVKEV